jgi:caffeoyl-CoA O-methyltransferase
MTTLLRHSQAKNVLELGGFTGYSASWLMGGGRHVTVIEKDREHVTRIAALNLQDVRVIHSTALDYLTTCTQKYDLVFLDANKSGYRDCLDIILTNEILTPHGLLVADNVLFRGDVTTPSTKTAHHMHDFNVHTSQDKRIHAVILPVFDGLALIQYSSNV